MRLFQNTLLLFFAAGISILSAQEDYKKVGYASFYHDKFEGRRTSSGEKLRQRKLSCAHRTFPFGTLLRVTNLANNKSVIVTVNDRGPYKKGRIIDLTQAAARELDFIKTGHTKVEIEVINDTIETPATVTIKSYTIIDSVMPKLTGFSIQLGNFSLKDNMERMTKRVKRELDKPVYVRFSKESDHESCQVMVGLFENRSDAFSYLDKIISYYPGAFIVDLK